MPRIPRMYLNTDYFHVITQGINKIYIFDNSNDIKFYIKSMYELKDKYNIDMIAYCIMNNHAHMLIKSEVIKNLSRFMHDLNTRYGCYYNKKYKRVGYVFRDRYKSEGIYTEEHLYSCIKYIYDNPVKAGICNKPEEYLYSNYKPIEKVEINGEYIFMDILEDNTEICKTALEKFMFENSMSLEELKKDKKQLHKLIVILKRDYNISLRDIAINLNINREKVRRIFNK